MHTEAGQSLDLIVERKEMERKATGGTFFWGVGNAPSTAIKHIAKLGLPVLAVFSQMKTRPKARDVAPSSILVWRRYMDLEGAVRPLPDGVLVTSRGNTERGVKHTHYALMCRSQKPLKLLSGKPFDPNAFRNVGGRRGSVGASQVTVLLCRAQDDGPTDYEVNLRAQLHGSYWVRLFDPRAVGEDDLSAIQTGPYRADEWVSLCTGIRADDEAGAAAGDMHASLF